LSFDQSQGVAMSRTLISATFGALFFGLLLLATAARASDPASSEVALPTEPGQTVVIEWTGTAQPGVTGIGSVGSLADEATRVGCPPAGIDDSHAITLTVPEGIYDTLDVNADFQVEWEAGEDLVLANSRDLALSVYRDTTTHVGSADGGAPQETVGVQNPEAGAYTVVVCPFTASEQVAYRGRLTLTALEPAACVAKSAVTKNALGTEAGATVFNPELRGLPDYDAFLLETADADKPVPTHAAGRLQPVVYDRALGLPTFLWARTDAPPAAVGPIANERERLAAHARAHLRNESKELRLTAAMIDEARVFDAGFNGDGPAVVRFRQQVDGVEVFHRSLNVLLDRSYRPVAVSGYFAGDFDRAALPGFSRSGAEAVASAWASLGGALDASAVLPSKTRGVWQHYHKPLVTGTHWFEREPRAKKVWYPREGALEPAHYVELFAKAKANGNLMAYGVAVSARDGSILHRKDLKSDAAFSYRTFADAQGPLYQPYDSPLGNGYAPLPQGDRKSRRARIGEAMQFVTLDHAGIVTGDPWLTEGATETSGNNVDACIDEYDQGVQTPAGGLAVPPPVNSCLEGVEPRAQVTAPGVFDYPLEADADPESPEAKNAAVVNLFYMNNWLHDWWYNHGFDEAAGNAQVSNYDRTDDPETEDDEDAALEGDPILAQGQDASGRNNANMATPADGTSPVMQQYLFDGPLIGEVRQSAPIQGEALIWTTIANAGQLEYNIDLPVALVDDGAGVSPSDGCGEAVPYPPEFVELSPVGAPYQAPPAPPQASLSGKIALVDRGNCNTTFKVQFAIASGAKGVIVVNNIDGDPPTNIGNLDVPLSPVQPTEQAYSRTPVVIIRKDDGEALKAQLAAGQEVTVAMSRTPSIDVDGTLDNQIIAHEFFHYVHHRLTDSGNQQARAMSEGWGDINAFMTTVREDDKLVAGNATFGQPYSLAGYTQDDFLKGIRRVPYSTSYDDNAFTLRHIANGEPTPDGGAGATNSQVHSAGEIWANAMFECYVGILNTPGSTFAEAQSSMQDYIIAGFKMTPADATYTEGRDAVLAAAMASNFDHYSRCSKGFAKRGNGLNAVAPARSSSDLVGVVEDFAPFVCGQKAVTPNGGGGGGGSGGIGGLGALLLAPLFGAAALRRRRRA
jgi:hypothetical protein